MIHIPYSYTEGLFFYSLFYVTAVIVGVAGAALVARTQGISLSAFAVVVATGILTLLIGSKWIMFDPQQWSVLFGEGRLPQETSKSILGAMLGGVIGIWAAARMLGIRHSVLDLFAVSFPLGMAVQRIGCLLAGCCHGILTSQSCSLTYGPGSKLFSKQSSIGLLSPDAISTLPVHPNQLYSILGCTLIAILAWKTWNYWKAPGTKFLFSVVLYLGLRFLEEFTRASLEPEYWMGLKVIQWKLLLVMVKLIPLLALVEYRYRRRERPALKPYLPNLQQRMKGIILALITIIFILYFKDWFTTDERTIIAFVMFPLAGLSVISNGLHMLSTNSWLKKFSLFLLGMLMMSQSDDSSNYSDKSYTAFNFTTTFGQFTLDRNMNFRTVSEPGTDCEGNPTTYNHQREWDRVKYRNKYQVGGIGITRKQFHSNTRSTTFSLDAFLGQNRQQPIGYWNESMQPQSYEHTLWGISPMIMIDGKGVGFGIGGAFGVLAYDKNTSDKRQEYTPDHAQRTTSLLARFRLGEEQKLFLEGLAGYGTGSLGDFNYQVLMGSRLNTERYLFKIGYVKNTNFELDGLTIHAEFPLAPKVFAHPQVLLYKNDQQTDRTYRIGLGLQYRWYDK